MTQASKHSDIEQYVTGAELRWYERSIKRYYADSDFKPRDSEDIELSVRVGMLKASESRPHSVIIRQRVDAKLRDADTSHEVAVNFRISENAPIEEQFVRDFAVLIGFDYTLGLIRAHLAEATRAVGLPSSLLPSVDFKEFENLRVDQLDLF